jgi:hypothetical protein
VPASEPFINCDPDKCERSHGGILYPKLEPFAQNLLHTQNYTDLDHLVDGMDLDEEWGYANLNVDRVPIEYIKRKNEMICEVPAGSSWLNGLTLIIS